MIAYPGDQVEVECFIRVTASALARSCVEGATVITVYDASRWAAPQVLKLGDGDPQVGLSELATISSITGNAVTLTAGTMRAHAAGTPVARILDATLVAQVEEPSGTKTALVLTKVTDGRYRGAFTVDEAGDHDVEVVASVTAIGANATTIDVATDRV